MCPVNREEEKRRRRGTEGMYMWHICYRKEEEEDIDIVRREGVYVVSER